MGQEQGSEEEPQSVAVQAALGHPLQVSQEVLQRDTVLGRNLGRPQGLHQARVRLLYRQLCGTTIVI